MPVLRNIRLMAWLHFWGEFRLYGPIAILYFSQVAGSYALGMSVYSVAMLSQSILEVPTGVLSDMVGRKKTVVLGAAAGVLSLTFYAIGGAYWALVVGALFEGLGRAFFSGNNDALLHDTLTESGQPEAYQEYLGKTSSMYQTGLAISALIGSLIAAVSFSLVMWLSVIPMVLSLLISLRLIEPNAYTRESTNIYAHLRTAFKKTVQNPRLRLLSAAAVMKYALGESAWLFRSAFVASLWPVWAIGVAQMIGNATAAISFYYAGRIIKRFGEFRLMVGGMAISEIINILGMIFPTVLSPALMALNSVFYGVNTVAGNSLMQKEFTAEQRATMGSLTSFAGSLVLAGFSLVLGALADRLGVIPALVIAALLSIIPMALYWKALRPREAVKGADLQGVVVGE